MKPSVLALIPARGGSKSIPRKNIRPFGKHPLIAYSIAAAKESQLVDKIICSTDDEVIASVARSFGAETPFMRPDQISQDETTDLPVFQHALRKLAEQGTAFDLVVHLRPTCPLRPPGIIDEALRRIMEDTHADSLRSVSPPSENPFKMWQTDGSYINPLIDHPQHEAYNQPRQKLPDVLWHNGLLDIARTNCILEKNSISGSRIIPFEVPAAYAIDLDELWQWEAAEARLENFPYDYIKI